MASHVITSFVVLHNLAYPVKSQIEIEMVGKVPNKFNDDQEMITKYGHAKSQEIVP